MSDEDITFQKRTIRNRFKKLRSNLSKNEVLLASRKIQENLFLLSEFAESRTACFYVAKENEVQTRPMITRALKTGKRVLVPFVDVQSGTLLISELLDYDKDLEVGAFGVLEPKRASRRMIPPTEADLVLVPGVAFDESGHRLGYGKGYYDRFLSTLSQSQSHAVFIGLAYDFQIIKTIPHQESDVPLHKIVTEKRTIEIANPIS